MSDMTTSPVTDGAATPRTSHEIDKVFGDRAPLPSPASAREEWRRYAAFLKRPSLVAPDREGGGARAVGRMLALDLALMMVLIGAISAAAAAGFKLPENVNNSLKPGLAAIALVVFAAPLLEEIAFRSWLRGHRAIIDALVIVVLGASVMGLGETPVGEALPQWVPVLGGLALILIGAPLAAYRQRFQPASDFFRRTFALWFWLSTLGFALVHLGNYTEGSLAILLPLVLPQFALGTMLGYLRVHYGLAHAIALHAAHNAILFSLAMAGGLGGETPAG